MTQRAFLVVDAYPPEGREALRAAGATEAGELYERLLAELAPGARVDRVWPADPASSSTSGLPAGVALGDYDGVVWTGSNLTIHDDRDERVLREIELARRGYEEGVKSFGSCWALQVAVVAAGGTCVTNPRGREFGVGRRIRLTAAGRRHPFHAGRPDVYEGWCAHYEIVETLPPGVVSLSHNDYSPVQSVAVELGRGSFWATQYHPEYDSHEMGSLARVAPDRLVEGGNFPSPAAALAWADDLSTLRDEPERSDLVTRHGLSSQVLDFEERTVEVRNWLRSLNGA